MVYLILYWLVSEADIAPALIAPVFSCSPPPLPVSVGRIEMLMKFLTSRVKTTTEKNTFD